MTEFVTQSIADDTLAVAEDIRSAPPPPFEAPPVCAMEPMWWRCDAAVILNDYRGEDGVFRRAGGEPAAPVTSYRVPITFWLPLTLGPYPTILYGHGLSGSREEAARLAAFAAPRGIATVAIPALMHGEHPTNPDPEAAAFTTVLNFFAIGELSVRAVHATRLRDHFRQSVWDRLQVTRLLEASPDVNGDGIPDLDATRLAYLGVSLGGMMGPELLAATDRYGAAVLAVAGGRISAVVSDSEMFGSLVELLRPRAATAGDVRRFFPILQTVLDAGDPSSYGAHVLAARFPSAPTVPSVLLGVVLDDGVVPNTSNYALGRALEVPIVEPVRRTVIGMDAALSPVAGELRRGTSHRRAAPARLDRARRSLRGRPRDPRARRRQRGRCVRVVRLPREPLDRAAGERARPVRGDHVPPPVRGHGARLRGGGEGVLARA